MSTERLPRDTEREVADGLRDALERYEQAQRDALARLREDMLRISPHRERRNRGIVNTQIAAS